MNRRATSIPAILALGTAVIWLALQIAARDASPRIGNAIPDFALESTEGERFSLAAQKGKPVVVVFVASWCEVCREEMPMMIETYRAHQPHAVVFIGVDVYEDRATARRFRDEFQIPFPLLVDADGAVTTRFRVNGTPTTFFIDHAGILRDVVVGGPLDRAYLDKEIEPLLARAAP